MNNAATPFIALSAAYIIAFTLTSGFVYPIQTALLPSVSEATGLLFIPHGVRIIGMYYFGWRAIPYLLPASYLMWFLAVYGNGVELHFYQPVISLIACYLGVLLASALCMIRLGQLDLKAWKFLIFAGVIGSLFNGIGLSLTQGSTSLAINVLGYVIGDVAGLFTSLLILMYLFKFLRLSHPS
ncbi:MAG: hypothetical protein P8O69_08750 [Amylibacter sp.]|nr:hypothetical protein [Amylibacter sp.]